MLSVIGLVLFMMFDLLGVPVGIIGMYGTGVLGEGARDQDLVDLSFILRLLSWLGQMALFIYTPICFCMLMYRCAKNARAIGFHGFKYEAGWVVGWFFIPLAYLWMPYKAVGEVWKSSLDPADDPLESDWWYLKNGILFNAWWASWVVGTLLTNISSRMSRSTSTVEQLGMILTPFGALLQVAAGGLCIMMIFKLTKRQDCQARRVFTRDAIIENEAPHGD